MRLTIPSKSFCSIAAVLRLILTAIYGTAALSPELALAVTRFLPLALPCVAGCALALISVFDLNRQLARAADIRAFLLLAQRQTATAASIRALQRVIGRVEEFLSREISEWYTLSQEPRYN